MKLYRISRRQNGSLSVVVFRAAKRDQLPTESAGRYLLHIVYHSPTGMETGYGGSGPGDLALSILRDFFRESPQRTRDALRGKLHGEEPRSVMFHQQFKWDFIAEKALKPGDSYQITEAEIVAWLDRGPLNPSVPVVATLREDPLWEAASTS